MKFKFPLYAQIICVFVLNLAVLLFVRFGFLNNHLKFGWDSLIERPVAERVQTVAFLTSRQFDASPKEKWDSILEEYSDFYNVKFCLFDADGKQIAGEKLELPKLVIERINAAPKMVPPQEDAKSMGRSRLALSHAESSFKLFEEPQLFSSLERILGEGTHPLPPPPPRFFLHTRHPDRFWIGAMFPGHSLARLDRKAPPHPPVAIPACGPPADAGFVFRNHQRGTFLAVTPNIWQTRLVSDFGNLFVVAIVVLGLSLLVWWPFVFFMTRTLGRLTRATEKIAEGNFDIQVGARRWDEIGRLAQAVDIMARKLKAYVFGQKRFLGDIAHELCSPVARLQIAVEILERTATREQEQPIRDIREEVEQMSALINELLAFSKAGVHKTDLHSVDLSKILHNAASKAGGEGITINIPERLACLGDEVLLERAFGNIFRNAIRYAGDAGPITVVGNRNGTEINVVVLDCGPGVPPESIELLGQPFYRPESSRTRTSGGAGLGLSIVKTCIEACQGRFSAKNNSPRGLRVEILLKAATVLSQELVANNIDAAPPNSNTDLNR